MERRCPPCLLASLPRSRHMGVLAPLLYLDFPFLRPPSAFLRVGFGCLDSLALFAGVTVGMVQLIYFFGVATAIGSGPLFSCHWVHSRGLGLCCHITTVRPAAVMSFSRVASHAVAHLRFLHGAFFHAFSCGPSPCAVGLSYAALVFFFSLARVLTSRWLGSHPLVLPSFISHILLRRSHFSFCCLAF